MFDGCRYVLFSLFLNKVNSLDIHVSILLGCGALAIARVDNLHQLWGILIIAALEIGGIVVPASIMIPIICPDVSTSLIIDRE